MGTVSAKASATSDSSTKAAPPADLVAHTAWLMGKVQRGLVRELSAALEDLGLRLGHTAVMAAVAEFGPLPQQEIAARIRMDSGDLVTLIDELEERDFVTRTRDGHDRRRTLIALTAAGTRARAKAEALVGRVHVAALEPLDAQERTALHRLLERVYVTLDR